MKNGWYCVVVYWKTDEISSVWCKDFDVAWEIANDICAKEGVAKVKVYPEQEKSNDKKT